MLTFKQYVYYISQKSERMFSSCLALPPVQLHVNSRIHTKICVILVLFLTLLAHTNIHFVIYDSYILNYLINLIKVRFNFVKHSIKAALFVSATSHMAIPSHFPPPPWLSHTVLSRHWRLAADQHNSQTALPSLPSFWFARREKVPVPSVFGQHVWLQRGLCALWAHPKGWWRW